MFFDPSSPIILMLTVAALAASVYAFLKDNYQCSLALLVSVVTARYLTIQGGLDLHNLFMLLCGLICIAKFDRDGFGLLDVERYAVNYTVSILYMIRIITVKVAPNLTGLIVANDISLFLLFVQIILVTGAAQGGRRFNRRIFNYWSSAYVRFVSFRRF